MRTMLKSFCVAGLAAAGLVAAGATRAQVTGADVGVNPTYEQTGAGPGAVTSTGGFIGARAWFTSPADFSGGTLTYGGAGSPQALSYVPADVALEFSDSNSSFSALQALYPAGNYVFDLLAGSQPAISVGVAYFGDGYSNVPFVTNFSALQGLNASESFVVNLNAYIPGSVANTSAIYFSISNALGDSVFNTGSLPDATTSITVPAGTLAAGQSYTFDMLFDNRISGGVDFINGYPVTQFYDTHTDGSFFTAVPEPSTWAMLLVGLVGLGAMARRRTPAIRAQ